MALFSGFGELLGRLGVIKRTLGIDVLAVDSTDADLLLLCVEASSLSSSMGVLMLEMGLSMGSTCWGDWLLLRLGDESLGSCGVSMPLEDGLLADDGASGRLVPRASELGLALMLTDDSLLLTSESVGRLADGCSALLMLGMRVTPEWSVADVEVIVMSDACCARGTQCYI